MATPEFAIGNRRNSNVENIMNSSRLAHPDLTARRASSARPSVHDALHPKDSMLRFLEEYLKHFALNFGQALQGLRYIATHPDIDRLAPRGSRRHVALSLGLRSRRIVGDLFFALIPPHWHHTPRELEAMTRIRTKRWFQYGYCAWRFTETGEPRADLTGVDRRWDPRCKE